MAIPTDYIAVAGSCLKKDFYGVLTSALTGAGWASVSSSYNSDGDVFTSTGNTNDKALVINLRKTNASNTNDVTNTAYCQMSYRFVGSYTPNGTQGSAGTFSRIGSWSDMYITPVAANATLPMDTTYNYKVYADKSKLIFSVEFPGGTNLNPIVTYIGLPDSLYCSETANKGLLFGSTANGTATATNLTINDTPGGVGSVASPYVIPTICTLAPKNPNNQGKYTVSDIYYGSATEGVRGKLDGIVALPTTGVLTGDIIQIGTYSYYVLSCQSVGNNAFPSLALAIRTA